MKLNANGTEISIMGNILDENSYISLTDIAKQKDPEIGRASCRERVCVPV